MFLVENANLILELAKNVSGLFQTAEEKRKLINLLIYNCTYKDGKLDLAMAKPFDIIMETSKSGKWLPEQEENIKLKRLIWVGSSKSDLLGFLEEVIRSIGFGLYLAQTGEKSVYSKILKGFSGEV